MAQPNPPGRKQGEDLLTEDPEYKRKDRSEQNRSEQNKSEQNRTKENENVTYNEERKENYDKEGDTEKDGRKVPRSQDEDAVDDDEDEMI